MRRHRPLMPSATQPAPGTPKPEPTKATADVPAPEPIPGDNAATVSAIRDSEGLHVRFSFATVTPAALFRRADTVWLAFDTTKPLDIAPIRANGGAIIAEVKPFPLDNGQAIRIRLNRPQMPSLTSDNVDGNADWILTFAETMATPTQPLTASRNITDPALANVTVALAKPGQLHRLHRSGGRRHLAGNHRATAGSRLHQATGFCRNVASGIDPRRRGSPQCRRCLGRTRSRQDHARPARRYDAVIGQRCRRARAEDGAGDFRRRRMEEKSRGHFR